LEVYFLILP
ncbi:hypothetical protein CP061683_0842B, partial [Chlamydia psittaci 06-1683]